MKNELLASFLTMSYTPLLAASNKEETYPSKT